MAKTIAMNDPFGLAIQDFYFKGKAEDIVVNSNYTEDERIPVSWLFRNHNEMPLIEKRAIQECRGEILDIGAAAGCHSIVLQKNKFDITSLEISPLACDVLKKRGIKKVLCSDIFDFQQNRFDTLLVLMNGAGIGQTLNGLSTLLNHLKKILKPNGQILIDSSDIKYLFEEEDGSFWLDLASSNYYGEMEYEVKYKSHKSKFKWLFIDYNKMADIAQNIGFTCTKIVEGEHFDYLAKLSVEH